MTDNVNVKPGEGATVISVATDDVSGVHYPIYKLAVGADGEATLVDEDNVIPIALNNANLIELTDLNNRILKQLMIMNIHLSKLTDEVIESKEVQV